MTPADDTGDDSEMRTSARVPLAEPPEFPGALADVLASIRMLVTAETEARQGPASTDGVLMLTPQMRVEQPDADDGPEDDGPEDDSADEIGGAAPADPAGQLLAKGIGTGPWPGLRLDATPGAPAPILDEEALRGVINAIVREELQGELGERIARNLRKLVRREIAEMMSAARRSDEPERGAD